MDATLDELSKTNKDIKVLEGKKIELAREKAKLDNKRQVFLEELQKIDEKLSSVTHDLKSIETEYKSNKWRRARLRFRLIYHVIYTCCHHVTTLVTFLFLNILHVTYVALTLGASFAKTILESHQSNQSGSVQATEVDLVYLPSEKRRNGTFS